MTHDGAHCLLPEAWLGIAEYLCVKLIFLQRVTGTAFGDNISRRHVEQERVTKPLRTSAWEGKGVLSVFYRGGEGSVKPFTQQNTWKLPNFLQNNRKETKAGLWAPDEGHTMQQHRPYWHVKAPLYNFSGSIPAKFEQKLRRHKQTFGKNCHHSCIR